MTLSQRPPQSLADALGDVRAEIKALKAREAELRQTLLAMRPNGPIEGARFDVTIRRCERRLIDKTRLPDFILHDDRYWKRSHTDTVVTRLRRAPSPVSRDGVLELFEPF